MTGTDPECWEEYPSLSEYQQRVFSDQLGPCGGQCYTSYISMIIESLWYKYEEDPCQLQATKLLMQVPTPVDLQLSILIFPFRF